MLTDLAENLLAGKKVQINAWHRILGTEVLSYEEFHHKTTQTSKENELYSASIGITCKSVRKRSPTFITVMMQIRTFFLNLGTSSKNFETTKYSLEKSFQKKMRISKNK